jgi:hypothetical protein
MKKIVRGYKDFDVNESFFSRENEEDLTNDNSFSESEESAKESDKEKEKKKDEAESDSSKKKDGEKKEKKGEESGKEEEESFEFASDENEMTSDNDMEDANDDKIDDEIQSTAAKTNSFDGFNPNVSMLPREWSIVKHMSDHGVRLGLCFTSDIDGEEEIESNLDYQTAMANLDKHSDELGVQKFDHDIEKYVGGLSKSIIKKEDPKTSYGE